MSEQTATAITGIPDWTLGDRMGKSMKAAGVSRKTMAKYLDVGISTISTWTGDHIKPNKQTLRLWALRTGVPLEWLEAGNLPHPAGPNEGANGVHTHE